MKTPQTHRTSTRTKGREVKAGIWLARHPGFTLTLTAVTASGLQFGWSTTAGALGATAAGLGAWYRTHPDTFDAYAAPRLRATRRRWTAYRGRRWQRILSNCGLTLIDRRSGEERFPRIRKIAAHTPTVETVRLRLVIGQHIGMFEQQLPALTAALKVERVAVQRLAPDEIGLIVQRREPFIEVIDAPDMPFTSDAVDLSDLYIGENEFGGEWRMPILGQHLFGAGATGSGKNSIVMAILRGLAPMIRDGLVRLWICDPKQMEFATLAPIAHRYATDDGDCADLVADYVEDMKRTQAGFCVDNRRQITVSQQTPLNLLILDELGALLAYGDATTARELRKSLALVGSQGRATGHSMIGLVQEPTKDTVPVRDLFTLRFCLRLTVAGQVDGVLGEGSRLRGALADEIPNVPETSGVGYMVQQRNRTPMRVRAAYTADHQITELVDFVRAGTHDSPANLRAVS